MIHRFARLGLFALLLVSSTASAERMMPCMQLQAWPTEQFQTAEPMPFNIMFWLPPIDPAFTYNLCRLEVINGQRNTRCIRLLQAEDMEPLPWPGNPMTAHELERDHVAIDDEEWQQLLEHDCWELQAMGVNGPVDFLGHICPRGPADTEAPSAPRVSAFYERPVWGAPSQDTSGMEDRIFDCNTFSDRAGSGQLRLHFTTEDLGPSADGSSDVETQCGDLRIEGDEECDDGNQRDGDGCSARCRDEEGPLLIHVQVFAGDDLLLDSARPIQNRLTLNVEIGNRGPETLRVQARVVDVAGQFSPWANADEITDERVAGCACTGSEPWTLSLLALGLIRSRRRRV